MSAYHLKENELQVCELLGSPLPLGDSHSVSVSLPKWSHVIGYEEGDPQVTNQLSTGYPRFRIHESVLELNNFISQTFNEKENRKVMVVANIAAARRLQKFLIFNCKDQEKFILVYRINQCVAAFVLFPSQLAPQAKAYWQHTGEVISSRLAILTKITMKKLLLDSKEAYLLFHEDSSDESLSSCSRSAIDSVVEIEKRIRSSASLTSSDEVVITVCGMSAIFTALRLVLHWSRDSSEEGVMVMFGFPYLDTLKLLQRKEINPRDVVFLGHGEEDDLLTLETLLKSQRVLALFTECPSNPLLKVPDFKTLTRLARQYGFLLITDDTIGNFLNVDLFRRSPDICVDVLCSSLTKIFSGRGNVLGGSVVLNSDGQFFHELQPILLNMKDSGDIPSLCEEDAIELEFNSRTFLQRSQQINDNTIKLVDLLCSHEAVDKVFHPSLHFREKYDCLMRSHQSGYGCLVSFVLKENYDTKVFYDSLLLNKGPSLGTNFTLASPYTLLAHYNELQWASFYGVSDKLIRISVGLEDFSDIERAFISAFNSMKN